MATIGTLVLPRFNGRFKKIRLTVVRSQRGKTTTRASARFVLMSVVPPIAAMRSSQQPFVQISSMLTDQTSQICNGREAKFAKAIDDSHFGGIARIDLGDGPANSVETA